MAINFYNCERILRLTPIRDDSLVVADEIMSGNVRVFPKLPNVSVDSLSDLWEFQFSSAASTYSLYAYALYPVSYLLNAFEVSGQAKYLMKALEVSEDFLSWVSLSQKNINRKREKVLHSDHAVSNRTQCLCYLVACLFSVDEEVPSEVMSALLENGKYLADIRNYSHYNHGLMMDLALTGLLNTLEAVGSQYPAYLRDNLINRLSYSITRDLTEDCVHVENSPGYHFWMLGFLGKIVKPLWSLDESLHLKASSALKGAADYARFVTRPDGSVPTIGDTHSGVNYKTSNGLSTKFFKDANQVIFRSPDDFVWAHFTCGYKTHVHKHCDNGSFNLFYKGSDVFIDPGFLNYENSEQSLNIKSRSFHNTVGPKGEDQIIKKADLTNLGGGYDKNLSDSAVVGFYSDSKFEASLARIADYAACVVERLVVWLKPNVFLIVDEPSELMQPLEQIFHVAPDKMIQVEESVVNVAASDGLRVCKVVPLLMSAGRFGKISELKVEPGFCAKQFNSLSESQRLVFESCGGTILTLIQLGDQAEEDAKVESVDGSVVYVCIAGKEVEVDISLIKSRVIASV